MMKSNFIQAWCLCAFVVASSKPPSPTPFCACDVCDDENMLPPPDNRIRIAAVGDSITRGHPLQKDQLQYNYPCNLQRLLGDDKYVVFNFGAGGHTLLRAAPPVLYANKSFWNSTQYTKAVASAPHMVLIMLGTNDAVENIWSALGEKYSDTYKELISVFQDLSSKPIVRAMSTCPLYNGHFADINQTVVNTILPGEISGVAADVRLPPPVPVFEGMGGRNLSHHSWFWGNGSYGCHPNKAGYAQLAQIVFQNISQPLKSGVGS
eukprot:m.283688 g.283688  ORF g.283688 m.283688 type:complete len:264 (-) comp19881_c0_seq4:208-999(-)